MKRALQKVGEKEYNVVFNNCEHFKNWVLNGKSSSKQVETVGGVMLTSGTLMLLAGMSIGNKKIEKAGKIILLVLVVIIVIAILFSVANDSKKE